MLEHAAGDDGVVIVAPLRSDRRVAGLSTRPLTGVDKRMGRGGGMGLSSPNGNSIVNHAGEVSATVMKYPWTGDNWQTEAAVRDVYGDAVAYLAIPQ
jgi:hypothetical protein